MFGSLFATITSTITTIGINLLKGSYYVWIGLCVWAVIHETVYPPTRYHKDNESSGIDIYEGAYLVANGFSPSAVMML